MLTLTRKSGSREDRDEVMTSATPTFEEITRKKQTRSIRRTRLTRNLTLIIPTIILALMILMAIFADLSWLGLPNVRLAPHDPDQIVITKRYQPPVFMHGGQSEYLLGTDKLGRDVLSRIIYGSRISLSISVAVILITAFLGTLLGILAGFTGGRIDGFIMRVTDIALSFPGLLLAMLMAVAIGPGYWTVVFALSILGWASYARLIRGEAMRLRASDFVAQARVNGASDYRIMVKHIFPNVINSLVVLMTLSVGMIILSEAALSFLGVGVPAPTASWGSMISDGRGYLDTAWWASAFPGIAIGLVVLSGNFLGDWLRDKLDPRLRQI
jgi:peptide/nickel transport system permease protein